MFNVGAPELLVILAVAPIVLGPEKLPQAARTVGQGMGEIRRIGAGFQAEPRDALQEPLNPPAQELVEETDRPRDRPRHD